MAHLSPEALEEFKLLWLKDHPGEDIDPDQLLELATRTVQAVESVYQAIPLDKLDRFRALSDDVRKV